MQDTPLRVGVVGLGFGGSSALKGYHAIPNVRIVALAGLEKDRLKQLGDKYEIPHLYEQWEDLLARDDLDAVSVATPTVLHAPISIAALDRGLHVLCEKPLARTAAEGVEMVQAAERAGRVLQVVFNHRRRSDVTVLKQQIDAGQLGRVYLAKAQWLRRNGIPGLGSWFTSKHLAGGGPLIDLGVHMLDMVLHLLGEPKVLAASGATFAELGPRGLGGAVGAKTSGASSGYDVEDLATAFLRLDGGGVLQLETSWASFRSPGDLFGVTLYGTDGGAEISSPNYADSDTLRIFTDIAGVPAEIRPAVQKGEGHVAVVRDFVNVIRSGDWSAHVGREALVRSQIIDACYESARLGREVAVEPITR